MNTVKAKKVCWCRAYPFPHRERGGKCEDEREAREWQAALDRMSLRERRGWPRAELTLPPD